MSQLDTHINSITTSGSDVIYDTHLIPNNFKKTAIKHPRKKLTKSVTSEAETLYDAIPDTTIIPITRNTIHIITALIQQKSFMDTKSKLSTLIFGIYSYSMSQEKNPYILIDKNTRTCSMLNKDFNVSAYTLVDETVWLTALKEYPIKVYTIDIYDSNPIFDAITEDYIIHFPNKTKFENNSTLIIRSEHKQIVAEAAEKLLTNLTDNLDTFIIVRSSQTHKYYAINRWFFTDYVYSLVGIDIVLNEYIEFYPSELETLEIVACVSDLSTAKIEFVTRIEHKYAKNYFREQIRTRYFMPRPVRDNYKNIVVDSYLPHQLYHKNIETSEYGLSYNVGVSSSDERHYAVSRLVADVLRATPIPIEDLCKVVGYTKKAIKDLLVKVKGKNITPVFVGIGGTGMNTLYWLNELCAFANVFNIFGAGIHIFEPEKIEVSNMLRFPMPLSAYAISTAGNPLKTDLAKTLTSNLTYRLGINSIYVDRSVVRSYNENSRVVFYGAPDINSRKLLSPTGRFIAATHANNSCSLWLNPIQNSDIQVESYGLIQLNTFFMNQFRMAIAFLELLADSTIREFASDTKVFSYSFDGTSKSTPSRKYYWYISNNLQMTPET